MACQRVDPRLRAASSSEGLMALIAPISDRIMKGRVICTSPTTTPNTLYMSGSGSEIRPVRSRMPLMMPLSPISTMSP